MQQSVIGLLIDLSEADLTPFLQRKNYDRPAKKSFMVQEPENIFRRQQ